MNLKTAIESVFVSCNQARLLERNGDKVAAYGMVCTARNRIGDIEDYFDRRIGRAAEMVSLLEESEWYKEVAKHANSINK